MKQIRILADDLTGALDAAAAFGIMGGLSVHWWGGIQPSTGSYALDAATRNTDLETAESRCRLWAAGARSDVTNFKKIDSQFRGHTIREIATCIGTGRFATVIIAPALPDEGRSTTRGIQQLGDGEGSVDVALALARAGINTSCAQHPREIRQSGIFICDAATNRDLRNIARTVDRLAAPVLWVGSAGLARALGAGEVLPVSDLDTPLLVVVGTNASRTREQVTTLAHKNRGTVRMVRALSEVGEAVTEVCDQLRQRRSMALAVDLPATAGAKLAQAIVAAIVDGVAYRCQSASSLLISGGETAAMFCERAQVQYLHIVGEVARGVPASRVVGGPFDGRTLITKSGGFGAASMLSELVGESENLQ